VVGILLFHEEEEVNDWFLHPDRAIEYVDSDRRTLLARSSHVPIS
jgi:hypothetical protein